MVYEINYDPEQALVEIKIGGFWDADTAYAFAAELRAVVIEAREYGSVCVLSDARAFSVQASDVVERFSAMAGTARPRARRSS